MMTHSGFMGGFGRASEQVSRSHAWEIPYFQRLRQNISHIRRWLCPVVDRYPTLYQIAKFEGPSWSALGIRPRASWMVSPAPSLFGVQGSTQPVKVACFDCGGCLLLYRPSRGVSGSPFNEQVRSWSEERGLAQTTGQLCCINSLKGLRPNSGGLIEYVTTVRSPKCWYYTPHGSHLLQRPLILRRDSSRYIATFERSCPNDRDRESNTHNITVM
jgi:hypothetical protein